MAVTVLKSGDRQYELRGNRWFLVIPPAQTPKQYSPVTDETNDLLNRIAATQVLNDA